MRTRKIFIKDIIIICVLSIFILSIYVFIPKFKDTTLSIKQDKITIKDFTTFKIFNNLSKVITDVQPQVTGEQDVELKFLGKKYKVKLNIVDDASPVVDYKDIEVGLNNTVQETDFINSIKDDSEYSISMDTTNIKNNEYGIYKVNVTVTDKYNNETSKECLYKVVRVYSSIVHELGEEFNPNEVLTSKKIKITNTNLNDLDVNKIGEYKITNTIDGKDYETKVIIKDTKGPLITTKDIKIYINNPVEVRKEDLLLSIKDKSKYTVEYKGTFELTKLGKYPIEILAKDEYNNETSKTAYITVKNDDEGPILTTPDFLKVVRGEPINYLEGVSSYDESDGKCEVIVDDSKVNKEKYGTYKVTYKSSDLSANETTKTIEITIEHNQEDTDILFDKLYNKYLKGKKTLEKTNTIRTKIKYKAIRGSDPVWTGLTTGTGSCYVHAYMLKKALDKDGVENKMVSTATGKHAWVIVKEPNGTWRHYDPTPGKHNPGPMTDEEREYAPGLGHLYWNRKTTPKAV